MPNKQTFDIKPINNLINKYIGPRKNDYISIDPFANKNKIACITNDLDSQYSTNYNLDALDFLQMFDDSSVDFVLFDPPYSPRQLSECYKSLGKSVNFETTQASFWSNMKNEISRIVKENGIVICFGWNSQGIGKTRGFSMEEILLVAHGGQHNDTICTVEVKKELNVQESL